MNDKPISPQDSEEILEQNAEISLELIKEKEFQKKIAESDYIKKAIADVLLEDCESYTLSYGKEVEFINGITSDFIIYEDNKKEILATIECKRPDIGVTEYVRGIGQLYQYQYFADKGIKPRKYTQYNYPKSIDKHKVITALIIPSEFYKNTNLDISTFNYPDSTVLVEVNTNNNNVRVINKKILHSVGKQNTNTISISSYYFRDNRIFEIYLLLRYLTLKQSLYVSKVYRKQSEQELRQINTINNGNWRNAYITLSDLGFINSDNLPTAVGITMSSYTLEQFTRVLYQDYFKNYIDVIVDVFQKYPEVLKKSNMDIVKKIKEEYNGKDVLYLTESNGRYISSWLNIMRDDLGCLNFESRSSNRTLVYDPASLKDKPLEDAIKANDEGKKFEDKYTELVRQGRIR